MVNAVRKICVINQKGGVGKTTTTLNIAAGLSRHGKKVLIVDFDAQGNIGTSLKLKGEKDIHNIITENADLEECTRHLGENLDVIPSRETLTKTEVMLAKMPSKEYILKRKLKNLKGYDYVFIDCPPSLSLLNQNALLYAQEAFIPVSTDFLGFDAMLKMTQVIETINSHFDHDIKITKIIPTMYDQRTKLCRNYLDKIRSQFYEVTTNPIRVNAKLKEAPEHGMSIFSYDKSSRGAKDYMEVVRMILNEEKKILSAYPKELIEVIEDTPQPKRKIKIKA
jgi:chromosome partitioning protein